MHFQSNSKHKAPSRVSKFDGALGRLEEYHVCVEATQDGTFQEQLAMVIDGHRQALAEHSLSDDTAIFRRVFLSDIANQYQWLESSALGKSAVKSPLAVSVIEQPPLGGRRLSLWEYHVRGSEPLVKQASEHGIVLRNSAHDHLWTTGLVCDEKRGSFEQTQAVLSAYEEQLGNVGANLRDHTVRTWFYVSDIDAEYAGLVEARKRHFHSIGLVPDTHYVASTGIAGRDANPKHRIALDAYAVGHLRPNQIKYLSAPQHLGPTHLYGVTFERGTRISYSDRSHVYISGTASIDPEGNTLYVGDIRKQCARAFDNTEALLADAGACLSDIAQLTAYVRDAADGSIAEEYIAERCPGVPRVIVRAPVCRPNWLMEIECIALLANNDTALSEF